MPTCMRLVAAGVAAWLAFPTALAAEPAMVVIVRHAERASAMDTDSPLSDAGKLRAAMLADMLASAGITSVITTQLRRTSDTARPLMDRSKIPHRVVPVQSGGAAAHVKEIVAAIREASGNVLVVGHSNTVPEIVAALSGTPVKAICDASYSHLFVVSPKGTAGSTLHLRFGAADPAPGAECQ